MQGARQDTVKRTQTLIVLYVTETLVFIDPKNVGRAWVPPPLSVPWLQLHMITGTDRTVLQQRAK